jgi:hypothetical protein
MSGIMYIKYRYVIHTHNEVFSVIPYAECFVYLILKRLANALLTEPEVSALLIRKSLFGHDPEPLSTTVASPQSL